MANTYEAVFEVPAMVEVRVTIDADNQTAGLVDAHDAIANAKTGNIMSLDVDRAVNISFQLISSTVSVPTPVAGPEHAVFFYHSEDFTQTPIFEIPCTSYDQAVSIVNGAIVAKAAYGVVKNSKGKNLLTVRNIRGLWELEVLYKDGSVEHKSWIESQSKAATRALVLLKNDEVQSVVIYDYSDREKGPIRVKEIK